MAKNIDFMGATFPDVPSIRLPQHEGGLVSFDDTSDGNIQPADVTQGKIGYAQGQRVVGTAVTPSGSQTYTENGTYDVTALAEAVINVAGGGGASNVVSGKFKGTTAGMLDINLQYEGNGFPVAVVIYPSEGVYKADGEYYSLMQKNALALYCAVKNNLSLAPSYSNHSTNDAAMHLYRYKSSSNSATSYTHNAINSASVKVYNSTGSGIVMIRNAKKFSVRIITAVDGSTIGFASGIDYTYNIIYSS